MFDSDRVLEKSWRMPHDPNRPDHGRQLSTPGSSKGDVSWNFIKRKEEDDESMDWGKIYPPEQIAQPRTRETFIMK